MSSPLKYADFGADEKLEITLHQQSGGDIEIAARRAGHVDPQTTRLYVRHHREITNIEVERVQL